MDYRGASSPLDETAVREATERIRERGYRRWPWHSLLPPEPEHEQRAGKVLHDHFRGTCLRVGDRVGITSDATALFNAYVGGDRVT